MANSLLIHIPDLNSDYANWAKVDGEQSITASELGEGTLSEAAAAAQGMRCLVAIGSSAVTLTSVELPAGAGKRARATVPFALEEELADDVEELHFALGPAGSDKSYPVAVIGRVVLQKLLDDLEAVDLKPQQIIPDVLFLQQGDTDEWQVLQTDRDMLVRQGAFTGMWCPAGSGEIMLQRLLREVGVDGPAQLAFYMTPGQFLPEVSTLVEQVEVHSSAEALIRGMSSHHINLLQGEFNQNKALDKLWKPWRVPAALAAGLLVLSVGANVLENSRLGEQESSQRAEMESLLKQTFPNVKRVRDPIARMRSELSKLKSGDAEGKLLTLVAALSEAIQATPGTTMKSVNFRNGRADVDMKTGTLQSLDKIKQALDATKGVKASIKSANQRDGSVHGRLLIEAG